jgi:hypothetical protein
MRASQKTLGCIIGGSTVFVGLLVFVFVYLQFTNFRSALDTTREWARLAEYPASANDFRVQTAGSMLTREFTVTFTASLNDIDDWLKRSPGTAEITPVITGSVRKYEIEPGGGAVGAEVEVDDGSGTVTINVCWS